MPTTERLDVILGSWGTEVEKRNPELCTHEVYIVINTLFACTDRSRKIHIFISEGFDTEINSVQLFFFHFPAECRVLFRKRLSDRGDKHYRSKSLSTTHLLPRMFLLKFSQTTGKVILK